MKRGRGLGFWGATALVVGNIIGSSIFMLPAVLAPFGANALIAWAVSITGATCLAFVYAQLALHLPAGAGSHGHVKILLGDDAAWLGSWGYLLSVWTANAAITVAGVSYCLSVVPGLERWSFGPEALGLLVITLLLAANLRALGGSVQIVSTLLKLIPFLLVITFGFWLVIDKGDAAFDGMSQRAIAWEPALASVGITLFALLGLESAAVQARAVRDPNTIVPRATIAGLLLAGFVSIAVTCIVAYMMPVAQVTNSSAPIADFIGRFIGGGAGLLVAVFAAISCFGTLNGCLLVGGELTAAMASSDGLPKRLTERSERGTPIVGLVSCALVSMIFLLLAFSRRGAAAFEFVALLSTTTSLVFFVICTLAALQAWLSGRLPKTRGTLFACLGALVFSMVALYSAGLESALWGVACIAAGHAWRWVSLARRSASR
ncbi:MAG: amino acid permease [Gammaproteobacteria bacterium]|nr:amino acid permease [Gammaproteobacteria bacterium]